MAETPYRRRNGNVASIRLRFIRKTHCQKDFMLWRGSARLGGVSGVDFNILGNPAELVRKLKVNTDIAVFVNLDMVYQSGPGLAERTIHGHRPCIEVRPSFRQGFSASRQTFY